MSVLDTLSKALLLINRKSELPIGSIYMNKTNSKNPSSKELLGYGVWEEIGGCVLVGQDSGTFKTLGGKVGSESVTLSESEIPEMKGELSAHGGKSYVTSFSSGSGVFKKSTLLKKIVSQSPATATYDTVSSVNFNYGGGQGHSNIQPSLVVKMWVRTA